MASTATRVEATTGSERPHATAAHRTPSGGDLRRAFGLWRGHERVVIAIAVVTVLSVVATLLTPWLFGRAVNSVQNENEGEIVAFGLALIAFGLVAAALIGLRELLSGRLAVAIEFSLRNEVYRHILELDRQFFQGRQAGQLVSLIMITSRPIRQFLAIALPKITSDALTFLFAGVAMAIVDPRLALLSFWPVPIVVVLVVRFSRVLTPKMRAQQEAMGDVTASAEETLREMLTVETLAAQPGRAAHFTSATHRWHSVARKVVKIGAQYDPAIPAIPMFAWAGLFLVGGYSVIDGDLSLGRFVTFLGFVAMMLNPLARFGHRLWTTEQALASASRVFEILDRRPLIADRTDAVALASDDHSVALRNVTRRVSGQLSALDAVELDIAAGRNVVIAGFTGSGKSSLLDLIARVHDPEEGAIELGGLQLPAVRLDVVRSTVATVGSAPHLFASSVFDNLVYGNPGATLDDVVAVTSRLGLDDAIRALPGGYDCVIGEAGHEVSASVAQGISIARAMIRRPRILLLDDITAPLSPDDERTVVDGLRALTEEVTVVAVAARPALLALADDVLVLDRGVIDGHGTLDDVARVSPVFRALLEAWRTDMGPTGGDRR